MASGHIRDRVKEERHFLRAIPALRLRFGRDDDLRRGPPTPQTKIARMR